jgi:hypothetical protein
MQAALQLCNNSSAGLDGIKFNLLKNLPDMGKEMLLEIYNQIFFAATHVSGELEGDKGRLNS